jgi:two-component system chemotaxis response regulator CheY
MGQQSLVVEAIQAGAKDFIVKPFQPSNVLEAVKKVLG